jgi:glutaredoxin-related protein
VIVRVAQVSGRVEEIDYDTRMVVVRNADGNLREFLVGDDVSRFEEVKVGDMVGLRVTEAFAMEMIPH